MNDRYNARMDPAPNFELFTGQARRAILLAYQESQRFDLDYLASEQLLAGLVREGSTDIARVFGEQLIPADEVLSKVEASLAATDETSAATDIFLTPRARQALDDAVDFARQTHQPQASPAHILRALLADSEGSIHGLLEDLGFDVERGLRVLGDGAAAVNRDLLVQSSPSSEGARVDPAPQQLAQLFAGQPPHADLRTSALNASVNPALAETDYQLFLTQLMLALTMGAASGYILYDSVDGMAGAAVLLGLVACFRNSTLGVIAGAGLGGMLAQKIQPGGRLFDTPIEALVPLVIAGGFVGSFLGNFWRRACPKYLQPSVTHQKPRGVV